MGIGEGGREGMKSRGKEGRGEDVAANDER